MSRLVLQTLLLGGIVAAAPLAAQNSVYSVLGIGFPGRAISVRARALGGSIAAFDPFSAVNPAAAAALVPLSAMATSTTTLRGYKLAGTSVDGLRETRFPLALLGGRIADSRLSFAASFTAYANRTYDFTARDTVDIRGVPVPVADRLTSVGAIADARGAIAWRMRPRVWLGLAGHLISGSAQVTVNRTFSDTSFLGLAERSEAGFQGAGISSGVIVVPASWLRLAGALRRDTRLSETRDSIPVGEIDLPTTVTGGLQVALRRTAVLSATATWRSWSTATDDLSAVGGANAFDTWELGVGVELGGRDRGTIPLPIRLGVRYAQLPFSPTAEQPREIDLALGTALSFAKNRAMFELALERAIRDGGGASERAWQLAFALLIQP